MADSEWCRLTVVRVVEGGGSLVRIRDGALHVPVLDLDSDGFVVETVANIRVAEARPRVCDIPSHEHPQVHAVSHLHSGQDGWRNVKFIPSEWPTARDRRSGRCGEPDYITSFEHVRQVP